MADADPTTLVLMLGTDPAAIETILDDTRRMFAGDRLVYLTDCANFGPFRQRRAIFEHLPSLAEQTRFGAGMNWRDYLENRWRLLLGKWSPRRVLVFGKTMEAVLAAAPTTGRAIEDRQPRLSEAEARFVRSRVIDGESR